jgi:hypothetical protein
MFVAFWLIVCPRLGDLASEQQQFMGFWDQVYEDFQGQVFEDLQLFFPEKQGKCLWTYCTYIFSIYSVVVVLHACVNECASMIGLTRLDLSFLEALV